MSALSFDQKPGPVIVRHRLRYRVIMDMLARFESMSRLIHYRRKVNDVREMDNVTGNWIHIKLIRRSNVKNSYENYSLFISEICNKRAQSKWSTANKIRYHPRIRSAPFAIDMLRMRKRHWLPSAGSIKKRIDGRSTKMPWVEALISWSIFKISASKLGK